MVLLTTTAPSSVAQTLDVDPLFAGGVVGFEVHNATPGSLAFFCFSTTAIVPIRTTTNCMCLYRVQSGLLLHVSQDLNSLIFLLLSTLIVI